MVVEFYCRIINYLVEIDFLLLESKIVIND